MARLKLSEDVLKLNPELAAEQAKNRAKTESGKGHGHTDDATAQKYVRPDARQVLRNWLAYTPMMMETWGSQWADTTEAKTVRAAIRNYIERMERTV